MNDSSHDDRLLTLARRLLDGEEIDWAKESIAESEVREGMKRLQQVVGHADQAAETETAKPPPRDRSDRVIGDFRLVRKLGEGGMGVVYEAEQQHPRRPVALKVIRGGAHVSPDTLKLFRREIQTLARLNHAGIAQLYEAGVTDDGMHFFAMELVRGRPLSDWLRSRPKGPMTPGEMKIRLGLFRKICDAVAYAHQKGVIHRDLKPGNILIPKPVAGSSMQDAVPEIKVLDFGLARITDSDVQATTFITEMGKVQGTLPYMSPEQVRGNPDEIDLRTDVYALGVMLYEMVTGRLPYDISKAQIPEAVRIICEEPPRSMTSTFTGTRRLDADVITIANKCLEKESARRYQSAAALGEDVQRYLTDQPILARRPSAAYQFRKLVARHKAAFAFIAALFVMAMALAVTMTIQAARIARERDRANQEAEAARQVSTFLKGLFGVVDPNEARGNSITAREILDKGAAKIDRELKAQPLIQAQLMDTMGTVYQGLGLYGSAEPLLTTALEIRRKELGETHVDIARSLANLASCYALDGKLSESIPLFEEALRTLERRLGREHFEVAWAECNFSMAIAVMDLAAARRLLEHSLEVFEKDSGTHHLGISVCSDRLSINLIMSGRYAEAVRAAERALEVEERYSGSDSPQAASALNILGFALVNSREYVLARPLLERALAIQEKTLGSNHQLVAWTLQSLGELLRRTGQFADSETHLRRALSIQEKLSGAYQDEVGNVLTSLGDLYAEMGRYADAEVSYQKALHVLERLAPDHPYIANSLTGYASLLRRMNRGAEAEPLEARALSIRAKHSGESTFAPDSHEPGLRDGR